MSTEVTTQLNEKEFATFSLALGFIVASLRHYDTENLTTRMEQELGISVDEFTRLSVRVGNTYITAAVEKSRTESELDSAIESVSPEHEVDEIVKAVVDDEETADDKHKWAMIEQSPQYRAAMIEHESRIREYGSLDSYLQNAPGLEFRTKEEFLRHYGIDL